MLTRNLFIDQFRGWEKRVDEGIVIYPDTSFFLLENMKIWCKIQVMINPQKMHEITCIVEQILCLGEDKVRICGHSSTIGHKVRDWLHDIPAVLPPGQTGQHSKLINFCIIVTKMFMNYKQCTLYIPIYFIL